MILVTESSRCINWRMEFGLLRDHLNGLPCATEETPYGPDALFHKVSGKMFAHVAWQESPLRIALKCESLRAQALRDEFPAILPGYYMNKRHWNTVILDGAIDDRIVLEMIQDSYDFVVRSLPKAMRDELASQSNS